MRKLISQSNVKALLGAGADYDTLADTEVRGFQARRLPSGGVRFTLRYYNAEGRRREHELGMYGNVTADQARALAKVAAGNVAKGDDVVAQKTAKRKRDGKTLDAVLDQFCDMHADKNANGREVRRSFNVDVRPVLGKKNIHDITRSDVVKLLDGIEARSPVQADRVLAYLRKGFNWFATREDKFNSPIVKGMARTKPKELARQRALDEQEVRDLWQALDELHDEAAAPACFRAFVKVLFLTGTRLRMVANMKREEVSGRTWIVPKSRNKVRTEHLVPLTDEVLELIKGDNDPFVFSSDGGKLSFKGFSKTKVALDAKLAEIRKRDRRKEMPGWVFHDFRRTSRGLMKRGGVDDDICERVLGHTIPGIRGVYDVEEYREQKRHALEVLAAQVKRILRGDSAKVVAFRRH